MKNTQGEELPSVFCSPKAVSKGGPNKAVVSSGTGVCCLQQQWRNNTGNVISNTAIILLLSYSYNSRWSYFTENTGGINLILHATFTSYFIIFNHSSIIGSQDYTYICIYTYTHCWHILAHSI